jgi:hypothetical protein
LFKEVEMDEDQAKVTRKCDDKYGYGCENAVVEGDGQIIHDLFRLVKTHTGPYYLRVCRECENRKSREYNVKKKKRSGKFRTAEDFHISFGAFE